MKIKTLCILISSVSLFYCIPGIAGSITDSYTNGSTLTATMLDNVKSAVNDNDSRIASMFAGDGSAGPLTVSLTTNWGSSPPANYNYNFTNCVINAGVTLTVPSGTVIRCNGSFTNNGTISVIATTKSASPNWSGINSATVENLGYGHPGDTPGAASGGSFHNDGVTTPKTLQPGSGGKGIDKSLAATSFRLFRFGGGSGGGYAGAGAGGGVLKVYAGTNIINNGTINANGLNSCCSAGGGGAGIVILASITQVTNLGTINADGGDGADSYAYGGAGGGGGGGIIIMIAPTVDNTTGTTSVVAGNAGLTTTNVTQTSRVGGGGGGASGGNGGQGGSVSNLATGVPGTASNGVDGYVLELQQNPSNLIP